MILVDTALKKRELDKNPIKVGMIGSGEMAKGMINQIMHYTPGMTVSATYNRTPERAVNVYKALNIHNYLVTEDLAKANQAISNGISVITGDMSLFLSLGDVEVVVESTGAIEFGADTILKAFEKGKHVLSFNAELDSTLGPILYHKAKQFGVKYALGDGDQPGVTMNLYRYVKGMGFEPLVCGNVKGMLDYYRTPATQKAFADSWGMEPEMATNFADGTKVAFEQSCIANATGMRVAKRGMLGYESTDHVDNLTSLFDVDQLREWGGIVEYVVGAKPSPGVFVYATAKDSYSIKYLKYGKLGSGPLYSFYVPYHLLFFDIASSIARLIDFDDPVIVPLGGPMVDVVTTAKCDLKPGDKLDGVGGFKAYGLCENHNQAMLENLLPMGLSDGCVVKKNIPKDKVLTYDDVTVPSNRLCDNLKLEQDNLFK
ncbi:putative homoserine dehydrogenase-like protein [Algoriphagus iocasae]|jgi:predicted homoserine dehydrogenase-like protein|uniref:Putative homoserine dehydrogenase-like protein n=1 Tax=Algoriphagus iocasae TaxID=1836499 RepID=A0A841MQM4_9BACT|nr:Gfo/Idh/MocA family oxidoreductase [Algoriphagus iocasae]MBB6327899.1 putative homoserine dehydrogenase-like protein [Algoriphagus iocasae]